MSNEENKDFKYWVDVFNQTNGYGSTFNYKTAEDKAIVEFLTCQEWCWSMTGEYGLSFGELRPNENDPPDCFVNFQSKWLNVELVQLVEPEHKRRAAQGESPYYGTLFHDMQWSSERLEEHLTKIISSKNKKYSKRALVIDVLIVHTAETWLAPAQIEDWLAKITLKSFSNISSAFLLLDYVPGRGVDHWSIYPIFDEVFRTKKTE